MRYDVEPVFVREGRLAAVNTIRRDFQDIAQLGFDTVVPCHLDDSERKTVLDLAAETQLAVALPLRNFEHYVTAGTLPDGCADVRDLARTGMLRVGLRGSSPTIVVGCGSSRRSAQRGETLCTLVRASGSTCLTIASGEGPGGPNALAVVDAGAETPGPDASPLEPWLADYHRALLAGATAGLILDRYRRPAGGRPDLVRGAQGLGAARTAAVRELVTRARIWGPRILGLAAEEIAAIIPSGLDVRVAALARGRRRYVLVFNPSRDVYARGEVSLPDMVDGDKLRRAVEVPPTEARPAGNVFNPQPGRITLPIALRPGDAVLFELF